MALAVHPVLVPVGSDLLAVRVLVDSKAREVSFFVYLAFHLDFISSPEIFDLFRLGIFELPVLVKTKDVGFEFVSNPVSHLFSLDFFKGGRIQKGSFWCVFFFGNFASRWDLLREFSGLYDLLFFWF